MITEIPGSVNSVDMSKNKMLVFGGSGTKLHVYSISDFGLDI